MLRLSFENVWEKYQIKFTELDRTYWEDYWALKDLSFNLEEGEALGIIGENGSGKSTILKLIAGMLKPDQGKITVLGKVAGLLELGAGFQPELTGRDNIFLSTGLFGLSQKETVQIYQKIIDFASLGKFIYAPVKCYSQGMFVRLAFAIAIHINPEILLIDDTLAVGDEFFQRKCIKKIFELKEEGKTIIFVTHDMNMLNRLCQRSMLIKDGRIVKDDLVQKVIPLYNQSTGVKEGVGILESGNLKVIFNNGRLFLNWEDKVITSGSGVHTSFIFNDRWYNSSQADWVVRKEGANKLIAQGQFYQLACVQLWRIELTEDNSIKLDIQMESDAPLFISEGCTNIILPDVYKQWFSDSELHEFPVIESKSSGWEALIGANSPVRCIGVNDSDTSRERFPAVIFERFSSPAGSQEQVFNTGFFSHGRALQYKIVNLQNFTDHHGSGVNFFSGAIVLGHTDICAYLKELEEESLLSGKELKVRFYKGRCMLYAKEVQLTKVNHVIVALLVNGRWYNSDTADWSFVKKQSGKLFAQGSWPGLPISLLWEIDLENDSSCTFKIGLEVSRKIIIQDRFIRFECSEVYDCYRTDFGSGKFPEQFLDSYEDVLKRCLTRSSVTLYSFKQDIPSLTFTSNDGLGNFVKVFNTDISVRAREVRIENVESEDTDGFILGNFDLFSVRVDLNNKDIYTPEVALNIARNKLKFIFDHGRGRIFWAGAELTKGLALYSSLRFQGRWYDSFSSAVWSIKVKERDLLLTGRWTNLPLLQTWHIWVIEDNIIEFNVRMLVEKEIGIERLQANIMLSEMYNEWFTVKKMGLFSDFSGEIDDDWQILFSDDNLDKGQANFIGAMHNCGSPTGLPKIRLILQHLDPDCILNIVNSDLYHRGRVLQYLRKKNLVFYPGEYSYFDGQIQVGEDK